MIDIVNSLTLTSKMIYSKYLMFNMFITVNNGAIDQIVSS